MQPVYEDLTPAQRDAFDRYKANSPYGADDQPFAYHLNEMLRAGISLPAGWAQIARELDTIFRGARLDDELTLFRATNEPLVRPFVANGVLRYPAYMSLARSVDAVCGHFGSALYGPPALMIVRCPQGAPVVDFEIKKSFGEHEEEMLIERSAVFTVIEDCISSIEAKIQCVPWGWPFAAETPIQIYRLEYI